MKKLDIALLLLAVFFISCSEKKPETVVKKDSTETMTVKKDTTLIISKELKTKSGKTFLITESKPSFSISNFEISGSGFENSGDTINYQNQNPMVNAMLSDLDNNGFEELYILTQATASGSFMDILGIASNNDKSYGPIHVQEITEKDVEKDGMFDGYMGHDSIYISGNKLIREFPVYLNSDQNDLATGGRRRIIYMLKPGEAMYQLVITSHENLK